MAYKFKNQVVMIVRWLTVAVVCMSFTAPAFADQYDDQIAAINAQVKQQQAEIQNLRGQANNLQNQVATLNAQIASTNSQLQLTQAKFAKLNEDLAAAEAKLAQKKAVLGESIRTIYLETNVTPIEMLASSNNFSDFVDRQQYLQSLKSSVEDAISEVTTIKAQLEQQRAEQQKLLNEQTDLKNSLNSQRGQVSILLAQTKGQEAEYQKQVAANQAQVSQLRSAQAEMWARIAAAANGGNSGSVGSFQFRNWTGNQGACGGGYGYDAVWGGNYCSYGQDTVIDRWDLYNRECVSYAAWAMTYQAGAVVPEFNGNGNATNWPGYLAGKGYRVDGDPSGTGVVVIAPAAMIGGVGHAMVVESVLSGGWIHVSQYNFGNDGRYSEMDLKVVSGLKFIHFR